MDYLEARAWYLGLERLGSKLGLDAVTALLGHLGDPQTRFKTVHVTGTNGKGSTAATMASILRSAGYRTGLFTSPHLSTWRESISVDGEKIGQREAANVMTRVRGACEEVEREGPRHPTQFEALTAAGFTNFADSGADFAVVEVGIGGKRDATNVINPEVAIITNVSMEHTAILGDTVEKIAAEKAGIIKPGCSVVTAATGPALRVIEERSREARAVLTVVGRDVNYTSLDSRIDGQSFLVHGRTGTYALTCPLIGEHQVVNASTAVAAAEALVDRGFDVPGTAIVRGVGEVRWPGRLEVVQRSPLVLLDGAKDAEAARALRRSVDKIPRRRLIAVIGISSDKDIPTMVREIGGAADLVIATSHRVRSRTATPSTIAEEARKLGKSVEVVPRVSDAVRRALELAGPGDAILVAGSVFLVGEARELWFPSEP
jgi:dihydrofolate synthase/folylpolyglutamate synthase